MTSGADEAKAANESWPEESRGASLFDDLKRRKVFRVMGAYAVSAWLVIQVVDVISGAFPVPDWTMTAAVVILALGFPVAAALSWAFQVTPDGLQLDMTTTDAMPVNRFRLIHFIDIVIILVLVVVVILLTFSRNLSTTALEGQIRMAVLPLEILSDDEQDRHLSAGIADDIRTRLDEIPQLLLAARSSSQTLAGQDLDAKSIGERLGVDHVLEGSIMRDGDRIRVLMQLVDVESGFASWSKSYNTRFDDVFAMQNNISLVVASQLEVLLTPDVREALARAPTSDPAAFEFYSRANEYMDRPSSLENVAHAIALYKRSIDEDPTFGLSYAGLCRAHLRQFNLSEDTRAIDAARSACESGIELSPERSETHITMGSFYVSTDQLERAKEEFQLALDLDPRSVDAFAGMGRIFALQGNNVDAEARYQAAVEARPGNWRGYEQLAYFMLSSGRFEEAVRYYERMLELSPDYAIGFNSLGAAYYYQGNFRKAAESFENSLRLDPNRSALSNTGTMYYYAGDYERAARYFRQAAEEVDTDYRLWGHLADALRFIDGSHEEARRLYARAVEMVRQRITVTGPDPATLSSLAWYQANLGNRAMALDSLEQMQEEATIEAPQVYMAALSYAVLGEENSAQTAILKALELGFPRVIIDATPEFRTLTEDVESNT